MRAQKYSDFDNHKAAHDEFIGKIRGWQVPIDEGNLNYAKKWSVYNIS